jgi:hypothetical protein
MMSLLTPFRDEHSDWFDGLASKWSLEAALETVEIIRLHRKLYGVTHMSVFLIQPVTHAIVVLSGDHNHDAEVVELFVFFRAMSRRWKFVTAALQMLKISLKQHGKSLPIATEKLFKDFETDFHEQIQTCNIQSLYPVVADREYGRAEVRNMSDVLEHLDKLSLHHVK